MASRKTVSYALFEVCACALPRSVSLDTDTTVQALYGKQMGGRKSYNPKGKKSSQPMLTFIAETREYVWGELRNGDRPTGKQIRDHCDVPVRSCRQG